MGLIPKDWQQVRIDALGSVIRGASPRPKGDKRYYGGNIPRLMVEDVTRDKKFVTPNVDFLTEKGAQLSRLCKRGTLTVVCSGTPRVVGVPSFLATDACIHDGMLALVDLSSNIDSDFLFHVLHKHQEQLYMAATHGGTFVNLTTSGLRSFQITLPSSLREQRAISKALSDMDTLLAGLENLIAKKRDLKQAVMQQLLSGQTRLPGFGEKWEDVEFGEIVSIRNNKVSSSSNGLDIRCVELEDIGHGNGRLIDSSEWRGNSVKYTFRKGDVLFGRLRAYLRKYWLATFDGVCSTEIWPMQANESRLFSGFLFLIIQTDPFVNAAGISYGTHMPRSDWSVIKRFKVWIPSLPEQTAIADILSEMDDEIAALEARRAKTSLLKHGMMQVLLTGRTRLVPAGAADD